MKIADYRRMIDHCVSQYGITDPKNVFICVQWRENEFHPVIQTDGNSTGYVVVGSEKLQFSETMGPASFWVNPNGFYREWVLHDCGKLSWITNFDRSDEVKFLIATGGAYPQNIVGDINPHRTRMIENDLGERFIVFRWDTRDSGDGPDNSAKMTFNEMLSFKHVRRDYPSDRA